MIETGWGFSVDLKDVSLAGVSKREQVFPACIDAHIHTSDRLVLMDQVHEDTCVTVTQDHLSLAQIAELPHGGMSPLPFVLIPSCDAVITDQAHCILAVKTADCLPVLVTHPSGIIAAVHAGRRSTEAYILADVIQAIRSSYGVDRDLTFFFGPSISGKRYQIDREADVYYDLIKENTKQITHQMTGRDFKIIHSGLCTYERDDLFHSYRRDGAKSGRIWTFVRR